MRIATLIVGLLLGLLLTVQTFAAMAVSGLNDDSATATAAAAGIVMMLLWLFGSALVIPFPMASIGLFGIAAAIGLLVPTGDFSDIRMHGIFAAVLMIMAGLGYRAKKKEDADKEAERARQSQRDALLASVAANTQRVAEQRVCRSCGAPNAIGVKFCGECGSPMITSVATSA